tara:strand:+ start:262 stop:465 length:204 start_codon:yes stop_codon:yes gene_type:complete
MITDTYLDSKFYCHLSGSQISIILYQLEAIPQKRINEDSQLASDLNEIFTELESKANNHEEFNNESN